tara:strand:+ start:1934 stop:2161 length:228 start_codon:yes stop_codon:yes gene_type:complete
MGTSTGAQVIANIFYIDTRNDDRDEGAERNTDYISHSSARNDDRDEGAERNTDYISHTSARNEQGDKENYFNIGS